MTSPLKLKEGFTNEHLANFILSKFSFVAEPSKVLDDIGSDFFCTLFKIKKIEKEKYPSPQESFTIQIKSNKSNIEITKHLDYLNYLRIPFFVGVINRKNLKLTIYSGESLCCFFAHRGIPKDKKTFIELVKTRKNYPLHYINPASGNHYLKFPKVLEVDAKFNYTKNSEDINELFEVCELMQENIGHITINEYVFDRYKKQWADIYFGPTSVKYFRKNFLRRLAEVFCNLLEESFSKEKFNYEEFKIYKELYYKLEKKYKTLPGYLKNSFDLIEKAIKHNFPKEMIEGVEK